jgi:hypothetical protein
LHKKNESLFKVTLIDRLGTTYHVPLETTSFILQRKYPLWSKEFFKAIQLSDKDKARQALKALLINVLERGRKGIFNKDRSFLRNYGFDGEHAYQIDVGSFFTSQEFSSKVILAKSVYDSVEPIQAWVAEIAPDLLDDFIEETHLMIASYIGS